MRKVCDHFNSEQLELCERGHVDWCFYYSCCIYFCVIGMMCYLLTFIINESALVFSGYLG